MFRPDGTPFDPEEIALIKRLSHATNKTRTEKAQ
jgi:hypothetical protein